MVVTSTQMATLSFNQKIATLPEVSDSPVDFIASMDPVPLKSTWSLWEQLQQNQPQTGTAELSAQTSTISYGDLTRKVASVRDVQSFWKYFMHLPQPSSILGESLKVQRQDDESTTPHTLAAIMFFRDDIRPEWEDEANRKGGHFQFTLQHERTRSGKDAAVPGKAEAVASNWLARTDEFWNNLVLGLVGGTIEPDDFVTGIRLVDKVKPPIKPGARPVGHLRIEVWFRDASDKAKIEQLEQSIEAHLKSRLDGTVAPEIFPGYRLDMRTHEESGSPGEDKGPRAGKKPHAKGPKPFSRRSSVEEGQQPSSMD
jgi:translation initiation factor 4E